MARLLFLPSLAFLAVAALAADPPAPGKDAPPAAAADAAGTAPAAADGAAAASASAPAADPRTLGRPTVREPEALARFSAGLLPADFIKLGDEAAPFLARYVKAGKPPIKGALLYLPAPADFIGEDPIIAAALRQAVDGSLSVLAVQMPLATALGAGAEPAAIHDQALARARAALAHLAKEGADRMVVVVVGRAEQVDLARELAADESSGVRAVAAIGPWPGKLGDGKVPLLDLVPGGDAPALARAEARRSEARAAQQAGYRQHVLAGSDRRLLGREEEIARRIAGWAGQLPKPKPAAKAGP